MSNYAWSNPSTGVREQAVDEDEARLQAWESLHKAPELPHQTAVPVFEQQVAGWASQTESDQSIAETWGNGYAWTDPVHGKRCQISEWGIAVAIIQSGWPEHAPVDQVMIYRQRLAFVVKWDDPRPEPPAPVAIEPDTPSSLIQQVMEGTCGDLQRASLLASLWIAASLQEVAGALHYMSPGPPSLPKCRLCQEELADPDGTICPKCAQAILDADAVFETPETAEQADERRARLVRERSMPPQVPDSLITQFRGSQAWQSTPHLYTLPEPGLAREDRGRRSGPDVCWNCGLPEKHAIHGYTGD